MTNIEFNDISEQCNSNVSEIQNKVLIRMFSKFRFLTLSNEIIKEFDNYTNIDKGQNPIEVYLYNYLRKYRFITYDLNNITNDQHLHIKKEETKKPEDVNKQLDMNSDSFPQEKYAVFCIEGECIIIQKINLNLINNVIENFKNLQISIINTSFKSKSNDQMTEESKTEIANFCHSFKAEINKNEFIKKTIKPIVAYLIRRYFYPTEYFKDPTFFNFDPRKKSEEKEAKTKLNQLFQSNKETAEFETELVNIADEMKNNLNEEKRIQSYDFKKEDFIVLRTIYLNSNSIFLLVIHVESLYIFLLKQLRYPNSKDNQHEIYFCSNYSHRCFTPFYGFLKAKGEIVGFVYEFMSNNSLENYFQSNKENVEKEEIFSLMIINRIVQGIEFLHSKKLIYRDLKPSNILIDHDHIPYISDFETIRHTVDIESISSDTTFTNDIGSYLYASPEQYRGEIVSFETDIYSLGLVIYYIFEHENKFNKNPYLKDTGTEVKMKKGSINIRKLHNSCTMYIKLKRPKIEDIKKVIIEEINSFYYYEQYLFKENPNVTVMQAIQCIIEAIIIQLSDMKELIKCLFCIQPILNSKIEGNYSQVIVRLGNRYFNGTYVKKDYVKARKYYELAAKLNNSDALMNLGVIYTNGFGVAKDLLKGREYVELSANQNNGEAFYYLGKLYENGIGVKKDYKKAKEYYELAVKNNCSAALHKLGLFYEQGKGVDINYQKAREYYELAVEQNNKRALFNLAYFYIQGIGVDKNYLKAREYLEMAAKQNDPNALCFLGIIYYDGIGVEKNLIKAREYFELSAQKNNSDAQFILGHIYSQGKGVKQNHLKAIVYYKLAAKQNNSRALLNLGLLYYLGNGVPKNYSKAKEYFELSAQQNNSDANLNLGHLYINGNGVQQNYIKAKEYFEIAAGLNNSTALYYLGIMYEEGFGVKKDYLTAKYYYNKSANFNNPKAFNSLGLLYKNGRGVKIDLLKAKEYFESAAQLNDSNGLGNLGILYFFGEGVKQDYIKAREYFELSSSLDNSDALFYLGQIYEKGYGVKIDYLKAKEYYELDSALNNPDSLLMLGNFYGFGMGVKKDYLKAKEYYELSAKFNHPLALYNLGILYEYGYGVVRDYLRAKHYFELSAERNNSFALFSIGNLYYYGYGIEQNYIKAKKYFELSACLKNSYGYYRLGDIYAHGFGVKPDYLKAKDYYEISAQMNNSHALLKLGKLYEYGIGVKQDYLKAKHYYELSADLKNSDSLFRLGYFYSNDDVFDIDIPKAIEYFNRCIENHDEDRKMSTFKDFRYHAYNDLGLIYITVFKDIKKGTDFIKEAAFAEYPFGQNNFGLINQLYLDEIGNAQYMFERSSKHHFALAEYNLGFLKEKNGNVEESIEYYIKASEDEDVEVSFHDIYHYDKRLEISKTFIICFTNIKLAEYYFVEKNFEESKKYFVKAFSKFDEEQENSKYKFRFRFYSNHDDCFLYLRSFILNFPLFNLKNQPNLSKDIIEKIHDYGLKFQSFESKEKDENIETKTNNINNNNNKCKINDALNSNKDGLNMLKVNQNYESIDDFVISEPQVLFDYILKKENLKNVFITEIHDILDIMKKILYTPPYDILFGRLFIEKQNYEIKETSNQFIKDINDEFYEGLGLNEFKKAHS